MGSFFYVRRAPTDDPPLDECLALLTKISESQENVYNSKRVNFAWHSNTRLGNE